jgi:cobalt/nickel transport system ATP-binding protein
LSAPAIELRALAHAYADGTLALRGADLRILPGEAVAIVGANGAGKSTLLQHLTGLLLASSGSVHIEGLELTRANLPAVRRSVGYVFQDADDQLFMPTVRDDVAFGPLNLGLPVDEASARVDAALAAVGARHLARRPPYRFSGGEKRAVAIAGVLAMAPSILVLDEPSSGLDPAGRRRLIQLLCASRTRASLPRTTSTWCSTPASAWWCCTRAACTPMARHVSCSPTPSCCGNAGSSHHWAACPASIASVLLGDVVRQLR